MAAMQTGLPPKVEIVLPRQLPAISSVVIVAAAGIPPAIPFAMTMMSGTTSQCSIPNHLPPVRPNPACTSSQMKTPPYDRMISAMRWKYPARRHDVAAHALDGLGDEGGGAAVGGGLDDLDQVAGVDLDQFLVRSGAEGGAVGVRRERMRDPAHRRGEHAPLRVRGDRRRHAGAAVVRLPQRDDLGAPRVEPRRREGGLDRLRAAVEEERTGKVAGRDGGEGALRFDLSVIDVEGGEMADPGRLLLNRRDHRRVAVAQRGREDSGEGVEVFAAVVVLDPAA